MIDACKNDTEEGHPGFLTHMAKGLFPFYCLAAGLLVDYVARMLGQPILGTVILLVSGFLVPLSGYLLLVGQNDAVAEFVDKYTWTSLKSHEIMLALLPILIFESAFAIEAHEFGKHFWEIIILAGPCFLAGFLILAGWMYMLLAVIGIEVWTFAVCLLYSAVISATDPVAVVMLLSKLGVPHRLRLLVEGESLLNDGVAIILFNIMNLVVHQEMRAHHQGGHHKTEHHGEEDQQIHVAVFKKVLFVSLSIIFGIAAGRTVGWLLARMRDTLRERATIVLFVFVVYCVCETTEGSGVLGVVAFALILNSLKEGISAKSAEDNKSMWQFLAFWSNWILFLLTGLVACQNWYKSTKETSHPAYTTNRLIALGSWAYVGAFTCRFIALAIYTLLATLIGKKWHHWHLPWSYTTILTWGGLRGSIALLLAMQMHTDKKLDKVSPAALACVSFTVIFSNIYHTLTANYVAKRTGLTQICDAKTQRIEDLTDLLNRHIRTIRKTIPTQHAYFWSEAFWDKVEELSTLPVAEDEEVEETEANQNPAKDVEVAANAESLLEEETLNRLTIMGVMSAYARTLGEAEVISTISVRYLVNAINDAVDRNGPLDVTRLYAELQPYNFVRNISVRFKQQTLDRFEAWCNQCLTCKKWFIGVDSKTSSEWWQVIWQVVVFAQFAILYSCYLERNADGFMYSGKLQFKMYGLFLSCVVLALEIVVRMWLASGKLRLYMADRTFWRIYDVLRFIVYFSTSIMAAVILEKCFIASSEHPTTSAPGSLNVSNPKCAYTAPYPFLQIFVLAAPLFCMLIFPFWLFYLLPRVLILELHDYIVKADNLTLELMHGILMLAEQLLLRLESEGGIIVVSKELRSKFETENMKMKQDAETKLIDLLNIQAANSRRMLYLKTRQVTRMILTEGLTILEQKFKSGEIDDFEYTALEQTIKDRMQINQEMFVDLPAPPLETRLKLIPWIRDSKERKNLIQFFKSQAKFEQFKIGEYLLRQGDEANGAFFLMSGICRFEITLPNAKEPKKLHLLYAGQFIGEKSFLQSAAIGSGAAMPKRGGSVYAETEVTTYFLDSSDTKNIVKIDPSIALKFEEIDLRRSCADFIRPKQPYSMWTAPALEKFITTKWHISERTELLPPVRPGSAFVLIKGDFEINNVKITVKPPSKPLKMYNGPIKEIQAFGTEKARCFTLELSEGQMAHEDSDSEQSQQGSMYELKSAISIITNPKTKKDASMEDKPKVAASKKDQSKKVK